MFVMACMFDMKSPKVTPLTYTYRDTTLPFSSIALAPLQYMVPDRVAVFTVYIF